MHKMIVHENRCLLFRQDIFIKILNNCCYKINTILFYPIYLKVLLRIEKIFPPFRPKLFHAISLTKHIDVPECGDVYVGVCESAHGYVHVLPHADVLSHAEINV